MKKFAPALKIIKKAVASTDHKLISVACHIQCSSSFQNQTNGIIQNNCRPLSDLHIPRTVDESHEVLHKKSVSPSDSRLLKISIVGVPNCGKSTLINQLVNWQVCSVSQKVHTTTINARAVKNIGPTQLVFLDTPGLVTNEEVKKHQLKSSMVQDPEKSLQYADCIGILHDVSNKYTRHSLHPKVLRLLALYPTIPSVLILNKVDLVKRKDLLLKVTNQLTDGLLSSSKIRPRDSAPRPSKLLDFDHNKTPKYSSSFLSENNSNNMQNNLDINNCLEDDDQKENVFQYDPVDTTFTLEEVYSGKIKLTENQLQYFLKNRKSWPVFDDVFMISALDGTGVDVLRSYFVSSAHPRDWIFSDKVITDQSPQTIAVNTVRAKCLEYLSHNIPYELKYEIMYWDLSEADVLSILIAVYCTTKSHMKLLIGHSGRKVSDIAKSAEQELRNTFRTEVRLRIHFEYNKTAKGNL